MKVLAVFLSLAFTFILGPSPSFAWGDLGHEVVCEIAYRELTPTTRTRINTLMAGDTEYRAYAKSCIWPDHPKKRDIEHYVNMDRSSSGLQSAPCPLADKCVITAIESDIRDLVGINDNQKQLALIKYLGHWIGDLHQPLHVSFEDDRGGGRINVTEPCSGSLHGVWDSCIIDEAFSSDAQAIADDLRSDITFELRRQWIPTNVDRATLFAWANESYKIAMDPTVGYCVMNGNECWYDSGKKTYPGSGPKKVVTTDDAYVQKHLPTIRLRLEMAGVRLGAVLNKIFDPNFNLATTEAASLDLNVLVKTQPMDRVPGMFRTQSATVADPVSEQVDIESGHANTLIQLQIEQLTAKIERLELEIQKLKTESR